MKDLAQTAIIGIDVSRDWLDTCLVPSERQYRIPNTPDGHRAVLKLAQDHAAIVCFESTGGLEWKLWQALAEAGVAARQVPPAQVKAFARSCGTLAKTDRVDAALIARFLAFRPDAGRELPLETVRHIRALTTKRSQLVETRKRLLMQLKAQDRTGVASMFEAMDAEMKALFDRQIKTIEAQIEAALAAEPELAERRDLLRSIPGIGPVASAMLIAELPELGHISGAQAAALTGLAPIARDSGSWQGKRTIGGGRRTLRHVIFQAALVARHHNPALKAFADRLKAAGKPHKVIITAVARKLITIANAICKKQQNWAETPA